MKLSKINTLSIASLFLSSLAFATTTYTLTPLENGDTTTALTVTTYVENGDGTVSSVTNALTAVVNESASTSEDVSVSYYNWDSGENTYVKAEDGATSGDITVYDTGTDVYQGGSKNVSSLGGGGGASASLVTGGVNNPNYSDFISNSLTSTGKGNSGGGAINISSNGTRYIEGSFIGNTADISGESSGGGAIVLSKGVANVLGDFIANSAAGNKGTGGAVRFGGDGGFTGVGNFIANSATLNGGAIITAGSGSLNVTGDFIGNTAGTTGGAIHFANTGSNTLTDGSFYSNKASIGGAIYVATGVSKGVSINASTKNVYFTGNTDSTGSNAIYNLGTVTFNAAENLSIVVNDGISGNDGKMIISGAGTTFFNNSVANQAITISDNASLTLGSVTIDGRYSSANLISSSITVNGTLTVSSLSLDSASSLIFAANSSFNLVENSVISLYLGDTYSYTFAEFASETELNAFLLEMGLFNDEDDSFISSDSLVVFGEDGELSFGEDYELSLSGTNIVINNLNAAVPEPSTYAMILGVVALGFAYYRRRKQ